MPPAIPRPGLMPADPLLGSAGTLSRFSQTGVFRLGKEPSGYLYNNRYIHIGVRFIDRKTFEKREKSKKIFAESEIVITFAPAIGKTCVPVVKDAVFCGTTDGMFGDCNVLFEIFGGFKKRSYLCIRFPLRKGWLL